MLWVSQINTISATGCQWILENCTNHSIHLKWQNGAKKELLRLLDHFCFNMIMVKALQLTLSNMEPRCKISCFYSCKHFMVTPTIFISNKMGQQHILLDAVWMWSAISSISFFHILEASHGQHGRQTSGRQNSFCGEIWKNEYAEHTPTQHRT